MPVTWFAALDGAFIVGLTPIVLRFWQAQARRGGEPSDLSKMAIGAGLGAMGMACLALASCWRRRADRSACSGASPASTLEYFA